MSAETEVTFFQRVGDALMRPLFGRDVFISYSRQDATAYVRALAEEVRKSRPELSICIDQWAAKPYDTTHPDLLAEARRSSLFIVVASEHAVESANVAGEIEQFLGTGRYMLAIDVDRKFGTGSAWSETAKKRLATTNPVQETKDALGTLTPEPEPSGPKPPNPSPDVVTRVAESITFETQTRRIKRYGITVGIGALMLIGLASGISWWRISEARRIQKAAEVRARKANEDALRAQDREKIADAKAKAAEGREKIANAKADKAEDRAKTATLKADFEQDVATALGNANEATTLLQQQPHLVRRAAELAVDAMALLEKRKVRNLGADMAFRDALQVLPQMLRDVPLHRTALHASFSPDGAYFAAIDGADVMLYETATGRRRKLAAERHSPGTTWGAIVFSRDSSRVAVAARDVQSANGWIHVWDTKQRTWTCVIPVAGLNPDVLAVSPNGSSIAFAAGESFVVDQLDPWKEVVQPAGEGLRSIAFNKSGDLLVTAGEERVRIWKSGAEDGEDLPPRGHPTFAQFSPDGQRVAVGTSEGLSVYTWPSKQRWDADLQPPYGDLKFSADSRFLAVSAAMGEGGLRIYDVAHGHPICSIATRADQIAFNADASRIATGSFHIARLWRVADGRELGRASHPPTIPFVAFRPDGDVVSAGDRLRVWRPNTSFAADRPLDGRAAQHAIAFDPLSDDLAIATADGIQRVHRDGKVARCGALPLQHAILFTPDGRLIGGSGKQVRVWSDWCGGGRNAGREIAEFPDTVRSLALSRDARTLAIGGSLRGPHEPVEGMVRIVTDWDQRPRTIDLPHPQSVFSLAFLPNGNLVSGSDDGDLRVWNWQSRIDRPARVFHAGSQVRSIAVDRTGRWIASAAEDPAAAAAMIWDLRDRRDAAAVVIRHDTSVRSVAFDPTGQFLATAGADRMVHMWEGWNAANPSEVARLRFSGGALQALFSPDARMLGAIAGEPHSFATITPWQQPELVAAGRAVLAKGERR